MKNRPPLDQFLIPLQSKSVHDVDNEMDKILQSETLIINNINKLENKANRADKMINEMEIRQLE